MRKTPSTGEQCSRHSVTRLLVSLQNDLFATREKKVSIYLGNVFLLIEPNFQPIRSITQILVVTNVLVVTLRQ